MLKKYFRRKSMEFSKQKTAGGGGVRGGCVCGVVVSPPSSPSSPSPPQSSRIPDELFKNKKIENP